MAKRALCYRLRTAEGTFDVRPLGPEDLAAIGIDLHRRRLAHPEREHSAEVFKRAVVGWSGVRGPGSAEVPFSRTAILNVVSLLSDGVAGAIASIAGVLTPGAPRLEEVVAELEAAGVPPLEVVTCSP
jgi:hypothetical protein